MEHAVGRSRTGRWRGCIDEEIETEGFWEDFLETGKGVNGTEWMR